MWFGMVCRMGPGMRQVVGFGDRYHRSKGASNFVREYGAPHRNQCGVAWQPVAKLVMAILLLNCVEWWLTDC